MDEGKEMGLENYGLQIHDPKRRRIIEPEIVSDKNEEDEMVMELINGEQENQKNLTGGRCCCAGSITTTLS